MVCPISLQTYLEYLCAKKKPGRREDENEDDGKRSTSSTSTASEEWYARNLECNFHRITAGTQSRTAPSNV